MTICKMIVGRLIFTALLFAATASTVWAQSAERLSDAVTPLHYRLDLTIDPDSERFSGKVEIDVELANPATTITLHGENLTVTSASIRLPSGDVIKAAYLENEANGLASLTSEQSLPAGRVTLSLDYSAAITRSLVGIYRSKTKKRSSVFTQMQPIQAREAFPAFDEPRFKTPFDITITHRGDHSAISNGPSVETTKSSAGLERTRFATTQPLPTYLVAIAVGEFDVVEWEALPPTKLRDRSIPLRGIAPKGDGDKLKHILEITRPLFELMEEWFGIPYPYAKLDLIAAHDFRSWGMENAGAIIYRADRVLLPDPPSVYAQRRIASLHAHELAHSWFGNYVTPKWWDDIWLNESFATWMANRAIHLWKPQEYADYRPIEGAINAMWDDRLASARSIRQPIKSDGDIAHAFNSASYTKGNGVIAMAENFLGRDQFQAAVRDHVKAHPHGVASTSDFLEKLSKQAGDSRLSGAMRTFLNQPGVPLLKAELTCSPPNKSRVTIRQSRYLPLGSKGDPDKLWQVPLCIAYGGANGERKKLCHLVASKNETVLLPDGPCPSWMLPNGGGAAYAVFDLDEESWNKLVMNFGELTIPEKISTAASIQTAYLAGRIGTNRLLEFAKLVAASPDWAVSRSAMRMFRTVKYPVAPKNLRASIDRAALDAYSSRLEQFETSMASFASVDPDPVKAKQRSDLMWFLALDMRDKELHETFAEAGRRYSGYQSWTGYLSKSWAMEWDTLHPNFVWLGLIAALEETGLPFAEHLIALLDQDFNRDMRNSLLAALGHSTDPAVVQRVRGFVLEDKTRASDAASLLSRQARRADNADELRAWVMEHYDRLLEILPRSSHPWIVWRTAGSCSVEARTEIENFFKPRIDKLTGANRALANVLENVSLCAALRKAQQPGAIEALAK